MDYIAFHKQVRKEFSEEVAICTTVVISILMTTKPIKKDYDDEKGFSKRIEFISREALWEIPQIYKKEIVDTAISLGFVYYDWDLNQSMNRPTTLKELVDGLQKSKDKQFR